MAQKRTLAVCRVGIFRCSFRATCQLRVRVANESETVGHWAFRFLFIVVGRKLLSSPMLLLLQPMLLMLLLLRSLKCSIKLVQPAIAQAPPSLSLLRGNDNFVFMAFYGGSIDPAEKRLARETSELVLPGNAKGTWPKPLRKPLSCPKRPLPPASPPVDMNSLAHFLAP